MELYPLTAQVINWEAYIAVHKKIFGDSPTRTLDSKNIGLQSATAFVSTLDENPFSKGYLQRHVFFSFIILLDDDDFLLHLFKTNLAIYIKQSRRKSLLIISGTLFDWKNIIAESLVEESLPEYREIFTKIYTYFRRSGFGNLWNGYKERILPDETIILY